MAENARLSASSGGRQLRPRRVTDTDAVLAACRMLVAIIVRSIAAVEADVNVVELRILTVVSSRGAVTLSGLAAAVGLHLSRASRTCDRMVDRGLLAREEDPIDRRSLRLTLTEQGARVSREVATARRAAIRPALRRMTPAQRSALVSALEEFAAAGKEPAETELWSMGWAT